MYSTPKCKLIDRETGEVREWGSFYLGKDVVILVLANGVLEYNPIEKFAVLPCVGAKDSYGNDVYFGDILEHKNNLRLVWHHKYMKCFCYIHDHTLMAFGSVIGGKVIDNIFANHNMYKDKFKVNLKEALN